MIHYLGAEDLLVIHALLIDEIGGSHGVRDTNLLASIAERPKAGFAGRELYPDVLLKAAALAEAVATFHAFVDGNKRTGLVAMARFLDMNGYQLSATDKELEEVMIAVATKELDISGLSSWLKLHTQDVQS